MRRTVPLLITALAGLVLIASRFIPYAESWGEVATIWFDVLASVAFVLGGGSLFKLQLKKISDRAAGWGYAVITLLRDQDDIESWRPGFVAAGPG